MGFGASGTAVLLLQRYVASGRESLQFIAVTSMIVGIPLSVLLADSIDFNLIQIVWQRREIWRLAALEFVMGIPFFFGAMFIGLAMQDIPDRRPGHYAASFLGSGAGGIAVLPALFLFSPRLIILGCSFVTLVLSLLLVR